MQVLGWSCSWSGQSAANSACTPNKKCIGILVEKKAVELTTCFNADPWHMPSGNARWLDHMLTAQEGLLTSEKPAHLLAGCTPGQGINRQVEGHHKCIALRCHLIAMILACQLAQNLLVHSLCLQPLQASIPVSMAT